MEEDIEGRHNLPSLGVVAPFCALPRCLEGQPSPFAGVLCTGRKTDEPKEGWAPRHTRANICEASPSRAGQTSFKDEWTRSDHDSSADEWTRSDHDSSARGAKGRNSYNPYGRDAWDFSWAQEVTLRQALEEVPKSGEVWCEGARLHLNPLSRTFDLLIAQRNLDFAIQFTPQYGDSFMEHLRLTLLVEHLLPRAESLFLGRRCTLRSLATAFVKKVTSCRESTHSVNLNEWDESAHALVPPSRSPRGALLYDVASLPSSSQSPAHSNLEQRQRLALENLLIACDDAGMLDERIVLAPLEELRGQLRTALASKSTSHHREEAMRKVAVMKLTSSGSSGGGDDGDSSGGGCDDGDGDGSDGGGDDNMKVGSLSSLADCRRSLSVADLEQTMIEQLELRCMNADPNYGAMWFQCRERPNDTARLILRRAQQRMAKEIISLAPLYLQALTRRFIVEHALVTMIDEVAALSSASGPTCDECVKMKNSPPRLAVIDGTILRGRFWDDACEAALRRAAPVDPTVLGVDPHPEDFATGLVSLNRHSAKIQALPDDQRRKVLFGCDQIIP